MPSTESDNTVRHTCISSWLCTQASMHMTCRMRRMVGQAAEVSGNWVAVQSRHCTVVQWWCSGAADAVIVFRSPGVALDLLHDAVFVTCHHVLDAVPCISAVPQVVYMLACIVALDLLHDAWFYWTHRLLHWRPLYKYVHWEHHRCGARAK